MKINQTILIILTCISTLSFAQDFARVVPGKKFYFPKDHGSHSDFKTEWWYFTGHLQSAENRRFGFQWTVFRIRLLPPSEKKLAAPSEWRAEEIYVGHLALSDLDEKKFYYAQSSFRGAMGLAESSQEKLELLVPGFKAQSHESVLTLEGRTNPIALQLQMDLNSPIILQGQDGYSAKSFEAGKASYYYSMPTLPAQGSLKIGEKTYAVVGQAWMDHEFGSDKLSKSQTGWDWFGLPLGGKASLMIYRVRSEHGASSDYLAGTYVDPTGAVHPLQTSDITLTAQNYWTSPLSKGKYPTRWKIEVPRHSLQLEVLADFPEQELDTSRSTQIIYWEGSVGVHGSAGGAPVDSQGYLEMTGYARRFEKKI